MVGGRVGSPHILGRADHEKEILTFSKRVQIQFVQNSLALSQNSLETCSFLKNKQTPSLFFFVMFISFKEAKGLKLSIYKDESLVP